MIVAREKIEDALRAAGLLVYFTPRDLARFPRRWMKRDYPDLTSPEVLSLRARVSEMERGIAQQLEVQRCECEDKLFVLKGQISRLMAEKAALEDVCETRNREGAGQGERIAKLMEETRRLKMEVYHHEDAIKKMEDELQWYQDRGLKERMDDLWCYITQHLLKIWR